MARMKSIAWMCLVILPSLAWAESSPALMKLLPTAAELAAAGCVQQGDYQGSLHAATLPATLMEPAVGTLMRSYVCGAEAVAVYFYEFAPAQVEGQAAFFGARLWGGPGPTAEHPDEVLFSSVAVVVVSGARPGKLTSLLIPKKQLKRYAPSGVIGSVDGDRSAESDLSPADVTRIEGLVGCAKRKFYCAALESFANGKPITLAPKGVAGITLRIDLDEAKQPVRWKEEADFLVTDTTGAVYGTITASNPEEQLQIDLYVVAVQRGIKVKANPLADYAESIVGKRPTHPTQVLGRSTVYGANSVVYLRETSSATVVIETFRSDRLFYIGVFPRR